MPSVSQEEPELPAQVWAPAETLMAGDVLSEENLVRVNATWIHSLTTAPTLDQLIGTVARSRLEAGVPVRTERLTEPSAGSGMDAILPNGMRLVTVPMATTVGDYVGGYVDVHRDGQLALQAVSVVATTPRTLDKEPSASLVVTPRQVGALLGAGSMVMTQRNPIDVTFVEENGAVALKQSEAGSPAVAVASRDLHPGIPISEDDVVMRVVEGWHGTLSAEEVIGRIPRNPSILAGEPIRRSVLASPEEALGLEVLIPRGTRLIWVPVDGLEHRGVEAGTYVDLVGHHPVDGPEVVAQGLFVMAVRTATELDPAHIALLADSRTGIDVAGAITTTDLLLTPVLRPKSDYRRADFGLSSDAP